MTAPFPPEAVAGTAVDPAESEASNLFAQYAWLARLSDEMTADPDLNLKRVMQLVLHARKFRQWHQALQARGAGVADRIAAVFALKKCEWPTKAAMSAELATINTDANSLADWIELNAPGYKQGFATVKVAAMDAEGAPVLTDEAMTTAKPAAAAVQLTALRALFGPTPA